jgi:hypothetical protein
MVTFVCLFVPTLFIILVVAERHNTIEGFDTLASETPQITMKSHHTHDMSATYDMEVIGYGI